MAQMSTRGGQGPVSCWLGPIWQGFGFISLDHQIFSKQSTSTKFRFTKMMDLGTGFTILVDLLKGCSTNGRFVPPRGVGKKLPTFATGYTPLPVYRFDSFSSHPRPRPFSSRHAVPLLHPRQPCRPSSPSIPPLRRAPHGRIR
jgi:hypothetical protein